MTLTLYSRESSPWVTNKSSILDKISSVREEGGIGGGVSDEGTRGYIGHGSIWSWPEEGGRPREPVVCVCVCGVCVCVCVGGVSYGTEHTT